MGVEVVGPEWLIVRAASCCGKSGYVGHSRVSTRRGIRSTENEIVGDERAERASTAAVRCSLGVASYGRGSGQTQPRSLCSMPTIIRWSISPTATDSTIAFAMGGKASAMPPPGMYSTDRATSEPEWADGRQTLIVRVSSNTATSSVKVSYAEAGSGDGSVPEQASSETTQATRTLDRIPQTIEREG